MSKTIKLPVSDLTKVITKAVADELTKLGHKHTLYDVKEDKIVETGEPDRDYDTVIYDIICKYINRLTGLKTSHQEFDKYQGVYITAGNTKLWTIDSWVKGISKKNVPSNIKYKSVVLTDDDGHNVSHDVGDYFMLPDSHVFKGFTLTLTDMSGKIQTIKNPTKTQLPKHGEFSTTVSFKPGTEIVVLVLQPEKTTETFTVEIKGGKVLKEDGLIDYLQSLKEGKESIEDVTVEAKQIGSANIETPEEAEEAVVAYNKDYLITKDYNDSNKYPFYLFAKRHSPISGWQLTFKNVYWEFLSSHPTLEAAKKRTYLQSDWKSLDEALDEYPNTYMIVRYYPSPLVFWTGTKWNTETPEAKTYKSQSEAETIAKKHSKVRGEEIEVWKNWGYDNEEKVASYKNGDQVIDEATTNPNPEDDMSGIDKMSRNIKANSGEAIIGRMREIVKNRQYEKVNGKIVDLYSASVVLKVYDNINEKNQKKLKELLEKNMVKAITMCYSLLQK